MKKLWQPVVASVLGAGLVLGGFVAPAQAASIPSGPTGGGTELTLEFEPRDQWGKEDFATISGRYPIVAIDVDGKAFKYGSQEFGAGLRFLEPLDLLPPLQLHQAGGQFSARLASREGIDASLGFALSTDGRLLAVGASGAPYELASDVADFSVGYENIMYVTTDGRVFGIGYQTAGAIGNGISNNVWTSLAQATIPSGIVISEIEAGAEVTFAIDENGGLWGWGRFQSDTPKSIATERPVAELAANVQWYYAAAWVAAIDDAGSASVFTFTSDGTIRNAASIPGGGAVTAIKAGYSGSAVLVSESAAYAVGPDGGVAVAEPRVHPDGVDLVSLFVDGEINDTLIVNAVGSDGRLYQWSHLNDVRGWVNPSPVSSVFFGGVEGEIVTANDKSVTVRTPAHPSGVVDVTLNFHDFASEPQEVRQGAFQFGAVPEILTQPVDALVAVGDRVSFTADASGDETPSVRWEVAEQGGAWSTVAGGTQKTLSFTAAANMSGRLYRAVFTNALGEAVSSTANLSIIAESPSGDITMTNPGTQSGSIGDAVELTIEAVATGGLDGGLSFSAEALPDGLQIDAATGVISGSLTKLGSWNPTVTAMHSSGNWNSVEFAWSVLPVVDLTHDDTAFSVSDGERVVGDETHSVSVTLVDADGAPVSDKAQLLEGRADSDDMTVTGFVEKSAGSYEAQVHAGAVGVTAISVMLENQEVRASGNATATFVAVLTVDRLAGPDRFDVAVAISQEGFPDAADLRVPVVYVSTGMNFPDALSAAPAAVADGGPLLLTPAEAVPASVIAEITRLNPERLVVVGGVNSVSDAAVAQLEALAPTQRIAGADRFEASRNIVRNAFDSADVVYLATGYDFPDALSAGAAAGAIGAPVILISGGQDSIDAATLELIRDLGASEVRIAGGVNSVSTGIEASLGDVAAVTRLSGADRFDASAAINRNAFEKSRRVFVATGFNFPDALAGAALAGAGGAPLYLASTDCIPASIATDIERVGAIRITLLGGIQSLTENVESLAICG